MHTSIGIVQGCVLMTVLAASKAYHYPETYSVTDDVDEDEDDISDEGPPQKEDYSKYFSGSGSSITPHAVQPAADGSAGFVQPIDFSHLFTDGNFGSQDTVRGIVAPPTGNIFAIHAAPVIPGFIPGLVPGIATAAANDNRSSHIGFIHPNPNTELRALFDSARLPASPVYQKQPFFSTYAHPATIIGQPIPSYSMYLPHFESTKNGVTKDVASGQRQSSLASQDTGRKANPERSGDEEYYDGQDDENENEESDGADEESDADEYSYEPTQQRAPPRQAAPSEPRPGKSRYPKKSHTSNKKSPFENPYPYKKSETLVSRTYAKDNRGNKPSSERKSPASSDRDYGYAGAYDYPGVESDNPSMKKYKNTRPPNQATVHRPVASSIPGLHNLNAGFSHVPYPHDRPTIFPTFPLTSGAQYAANSQPVKSVFTYGTKPVNNVQLQGGFVPSAPIPYVKDFPTAYNTPYPSISPLGPLPVSILPDDPHIKAESSQIAKNTKKCTKIEKEPDKDGDSDGQNMVCYKCHDVVTGASYEQCSYDSTSTSKPFFESDFEALKAEKTVKQVSPRTKRNVDEAPYDFSFSRNIGQSVTLIRKVRQYAEYDDNPANYGTPYSSEENDNYRFGPEYFVNSENSPEESDASEEVVENESGEQCRRVKKQGVICMVCEKPTGGSYEQCSYASDPKQNSYSYGTSSSYSHGSKPKPKPKPNRNRRYTSFFDKPIQMKQKGNAKRNVRNDDFRQSDDGSNDKAEEEYDEALEPPEDFSESVSRLRKADRNGKLVGLDPFFYGSADETFHPEETKGDERIDGEADGEKAGTSHRPSTYDDFFAHLFPELQTDSSDKKQTVSPKVQSEDYDASMDYSEDESEGETKQIKTRLSPGFHSKSAIPDYFDDAEQRKDLEMVLGEFKQKDRSSCKKVMRDQMTCYQCLDDKGMQHEECMFVAASEPKNKHLAYHEVKQFRIAPTKDTQSINKIEDTTEKRRPVVFIDTDRQSDTRNEAITDSNRPAPRLVMNDAMKRISSNPTSVIDNDSHAAENLDIMRLYPKEPLAYPVSTVTIQNQRYFSSSGLPKTDVQPAASSIYTKHLPFGYYTVPKSKRNRRRSGHPDSDHEYNEESSEKSNSKNEQHETSKKPYDPIPTDPPQFHAPEGPEGAYNEDTEPAFDTVLKITLPRYMLDRSEHEAIFDEVLASG